MNVISRVQFKRNFEIEVVRNWMRLNKPLGFVDATLPLYYSRNDCEHGNEPSGPVKGLEFLDYLSDYEVVNNDSVPWR